MFVIKKLLKQREALEKEAERLRDEVDALKQEIDELNKEANGKEAEARIWMQTSERLREEIERLRKKRDEAAKVYQNIVDRNMDNLRGLCRFWREEAQAEKARAEEALEVVRAWEEQEAQAELERISKAKEDEV